MGVMKYFLPALAAASIVSAIECDGDTITIENEGDAAALVECQKVEGDVVIAEQAANIISLMGVQEITGSLSCDGGENITELSAPDLKTIGNEFNLKGLSKLNSLAFASLEEVGSITFDSLAHLRQLTFTKGVSKADSVKITNTYLTTLEGIALDDVSEMYIANNIYLTKVDVDEIKSIKGNVDFASNHKDLQISFPNLKEAQNMTFRNASSVSLPSLESVSGGLGFYSNYMEEFQGPNLTEAKSFLVFIDNPNLTNVSLPELTSVGGTFQIANNTKLDKVTGVPKLEIIEGALDFSGNITEVELPALKDVQGAFNMQSSGKLDCGKMSEFDGDVVKGDFDCYSDVEDPGTEGTTPSGGSGSGDDSEDSAALDRVSLTYVVGFAGLVGALMQVL
ncbi:hypothetical protein FQN54_009639 [Arachnomyces sp. PD_36]|nr:hypothetical protein FQN54_009639 [Arachnomyces sp. PD_36]